MKKYFLLIFVVFFVHQFAAKAQKFDVDTLMYNGDANKYINLVILADGYVENEQDKFVTDADSLVKYYFRQMPYSHYKNYFNVFAVKVISQESGAKHPKNAPDCGSGVPKSNPNNYFGSTFDAYGIHRLVVANNTSKIANVLADNVPNYDQALILVNSPFYGGSGGQFAVSTTDFSSFEVAMHEIGHSFAGLADEYWAGAGYAAEKPNMTKETDPAKIKWKNWLNTGTGVDIYSYSEDQNWHRPHQTCKMRYLGYDFCPVCREALIEKIHSLTNPIVNYYPQTLNINSTDKYLNFALLEVMKPEPNTLQINWKMDGKLLAHNSDTLLVNQSLLTDGNHTLTVSVLDTSSLTKDNSHANMHISTVNWSINKSAVGINIAAKTNKLSFSVYPNPIQNILHITVEAEKPFQNASVNIVALDGKIIRQNISLINGAASVETNNLPAGIYTINFIVDGEMYSQRFMKQ